MAPTPSPLGRGSQAPPPHPERDRASRPAAPWVLAPSPCAPPPSVAPPPRQRGAGSVVGSGRSKAVHGLGNVVFGRIRIASHNPLLLVAPRWPFSSGSSTGRCFVSAIFRPCSRALGGPSHPPPLSGARHQCANYTPPGGPGRARAHPARGGGRPLTAEGNPPSPRPPPPPPLPAPRAHRPLRPPHSHTPLGFGLLHLKRYPAAN